MASTEGYNNEFVDEQVDYHCCVCGLIPHDVYQATCCGKLLCSSCLQELEVGSVQPSCPSCQRRPMAMCFRDVKSSRDIQSMMAYCSMKEKGCQWQGRLEAFQDHTHDCACTTYACPNKCGSELLSSELNDHIQNNCLKRKYNCLLCKQPGAYEYITNDHHRECPDMEVPCPNDGCDVTIARSQQCKHSLTCPKRKVSCTYSDIGCQVMHTLEAQPAHNQEHMDDHLQLAMRVIESQAQKLSLLTNHKSTTFCLHGFQHLIETKGCWESRSFFTSLGGYSMNLIVYPNGKLDGTDTHVSLYLYLRPGEYDDHLEWPMKGQFITELLNQVEDRNHHSLMLVYNNSPQAWGKRVVGKPRGEGFGYSQFINHSLLRYNPSSRCQYLKDDKLYFRVTVNKLSSRTKPWLVT